MSCWEGEEETGGPSAAKRQGKAFLLEVDLPRASLPGLLPTREAPLLLPLFPLLILPVRARTNIISLAKGLSVFLLFSVNSSKNDDTSRIPRRQTTASSLRGSSANYLWLFQGFGLHCAHPSRAGGGCDGTRPISRGAKERTQGKRFRLRLGNRTKDGNASLTVPTTCQCGPYRPGTSSSPVLLQARH